LSVEVFGISCTSAISFGNAVIPCNYRNYDHLLTKLNVCTYRITSDCRNEVATPYLYLL
jgi:hypothetical protein